MSCVGKLPQKRGHCIGDPSFDYGCVGQIAFTASRSDCGFECGQEFLHCKSGPKFCSVKICKSFGAVGIEMDAGEFFKSPQSWADPKALEETFHEDFMHLRETEMLTRD